MNKLILLLALVSQTAFAATTKSVLSDLRRTILAENLHYSQRWTATLKLTEVDDPQAETELQQLVTRKEWFLRNAALLGLEKLNPQKAYEAAKKLLKDPALVVRSAALQVLRPQLTEKDRSLLWTELQQKYNFRGQQSLWIRKDLIEALGQNPQSDEYADFGRMLKDGDEAVQLQAALALDKLSGLGLQVQNTSQKEFISAWQKQAANETSKIKK